MPPAEGGGPHPNVLYIVGDPCYLAHHLGNLIKRINHQSKCNLDFRSGFNYKSPKLRYKIQNG